MIYALISRKRLNVSSEHPDIVKQAAEWMEDAHTASELEGEAIKVSFVIELEADSLSVLKVR